jgi:hypothetical protein
VITSTFHHVIKVRQNTVQLILMTASPCNQI